MFTQGMNEAGERDDILSGLLFSVWLVEIAGPSSGVRGDGETKNEQPLGLPGLSGLGSKPGIGVVNYFISTGYRFQSPVAVISKFSTFERMAMTFTWCHSGTHATSLTRNSLALCKISNRLAWSVVRRD